MKMKIKHLFRSLVSLLLAFCMTLGYTPVTALAAENEEKKPIIYASIGDSMTNGYCLEGYDGESGAINYAMDTYSNKFAAWLAGYEGTIKDDQVIFEGTKATVDHRQLAISGMRAQDVQWILELDYTNETLINDVYAKEYRAVNGWSGWSEDWWFNTCNFAGDARTWCDFCDSAYRYADAAAKILSVYNTGENGKYYKSSYADKTAIEEAMNGIKSDTYFPESREQANTIGGAKYLQIATEYYQKSMADADIISLAVGNTNFGTFMLSEILDVVMSNDQSFPTTYNYDKVMARVADNAFITGKVKSMFETDAYKNSVAACKALAGGDTSKEERIEYIVKYCVASFIVGYIGMMDAILEMNPDANIIQLALMNAYEDQDGTAKKGTLGELVETIYIPMNQFLKDLPDDLMASKTAEEKAKYENAKFYWSETDYVSCMVDVFGDDYYKENNSYIKYPGLLKGTEGYTANAASIVRARFVEEIVCGDMIFNALGMRQEATQENIQNFLKGAIAYDMMTYEEKAAYAAQDADLAKQYALYLGFENALIRSGTSNVTMEALAGLANIVDAFGKFQGPMMGQVGVARADYYEPAAVVVSEISKDALSEDQVVQIMNAVEQMEEQVWEGYADYHETLIAQTGHIAMEHIIYCDTCMSGDAHGSAIAQNIVDTYKDQMDLLPYTVVAEQIKDQTNGLLDGKDIKRLCEAEEYESEVYKLISEKSDGQLTADQVKTLAEDDDNDGYNGVFIVANEITKKNTNTDYGADTIRLAYEKNIILSDEQRAQIETLMAVSDATKALLTNESILKDGAAGIKTAIDGASQLAYLLALPQTMSDELYADSDMRGALCMDARCLLGTGAGGHPSVGGHASLYRDIKNAYIANHEHTYNGEPTWVWENDYSKVAVTFTCDLCDEPINPQATISSVTTEATCDKDGKTVYTATVEFNDTTYIDKKEEVLTAPGHAWDEGVITKEPTETEKGVRTYTCETCGGTKTEDIEIEVHEHSYTAVVTAPTCTENGYTTYTCACGDSYVADEVPAAHTEVIDKGVPATCLSSGISDGKHCSVCGEVLVEQEPIERLEHTVVIDKAVPATCTEEGLTEGTHCSVCGSTLTIQRVVPATGHKWNDGVVTKEPTETETGIRTYTCTVCKEKKTEVIPELGHTHNYTTAVTEPTCTEKGYTAHTCKCGDSYITDEVPALGHSYGEPEWAWSEDYKAVATFTCKNCEEETVIDNCEVTVEIVDKEYVYTATCEFEGKTYTSVKKAPQTTLVNPFEDVEEGRFYYDAVLWAVDKGITTGVDETHFAPSKNCTRGDIVTFLWRANGCPAPTIKENPFVDVEEGRYYYDAVLWAYEKGITTGIDETHFVPGETCTRAQIVTFLWRAEGMPEAKEAKNPFVDVKEDAYYTEAVLWAVENGITKGTDETHFVPAGTCTRGEAVTFLYRVYK